MASTHVINETRPALVSCWYLWGCERHFGVRDLQLKCGELMVVYMPHVEVDMTVEGPAGYAAGVMKIPDQIYRTRWSDWSDGIRQTDLSNHIRIQLKKLTTKWLCMSLEI